MVDVCLPILESLDNNGNTLSKVVGSNTTSYAWDFENRMSSVTLPGNGGAVSFKYDPFGRRIYKSSTAGTSVYAYDGDNLIEETNSSGAVVARYAEPKNTDEPLAMLRSGATSYYHADGLGSVTSLSSPAGSIANTYTYDSFGKLTASTGSLVNSSRYTARESDIETGLYYYRARYYDPAIGRFLSEDPIGFNGGENFYAYTRNNPVDLKDPFGLYILPPGVPPPSAALDELLKCLDGKVGPVTVTATTNGEHKDRGHELGTSVDIAPPKGIPAATVFCAAGACGAVRGVNEAPNQGGRSLPTTRGPNYHFSRVQYLKHPPTKSAIPDKPECKPGACGILKP